MPKLTFYGGVKEIGGNKILLEDKGTRIFLDFGMSFGKAGEFFAEFLTPKKCNGISDFIKLGLTPDIKGLYRQDYLQKMKRPEEEKQFDGILISHAHVDHIGHLNLVRPDIPVFCSEGSKCIMNMLDTTSNFGEYLREKVCFQFAESKKGGMKRLTSADPGGKCERDVIIADKPFKIGSLNITPIPVNHSLPGAMGFAIETSAGAIIYTGDFRFHGLSPEMTEAFVKKAASFDPIAVITEGTRVAEKKTETEKDVYSTVTDFSKSRALIMANFPIRDTDRMMTFNNAAKDNERRLVVSMKQAYLLELLERTGVNAPKLSEVDIYVPRKSWGLITENVDQKDKERDYSAWEKDFIGRKNSVTCEDIKKNQKDYVWRCDFFELKELTDVQPKKSSKYIWSVTEPFDTKMELNEQIIMNWLNHFNISRIARKHVSGHANWPDLKRTLETIDPKIIFPIHTEHPGLFRGFKAKTKMVEYGKGYRV